MIENHLDLKKWKSMANQVLGEDFFNDFLTEDSGDGPRYNLYRNNSEIIVLIDLPYVQDLSGIKLTVREQELIVKGKIDLGYDHLEVIESQIFTGVFEKIIALPEAVYTKKVNAQYQRGILIVQLFPKLRRDGSAVEIQGM